MAIRKAFLLIGCIVLSSVLASASACAPGTLTGYISLGAGGCNIGTTSFANFLTLSIPNGATPINPDVIQVTPQTGMSTAGFLFTFNMSAGAGEFFDLRFGFDVADAALLGATGTMTGTSASEDGVVTVIEQFCPDGLFTGVTCSSGAPPTFTLFEIDGVASTTDGVTFPAATFLQVQKDIGIDGGLFGSSAIGTLNNQFEIGAVTAPVPEPGSLYLFTSALSAFAFQRIRRRKS